MLHKILSALKQNNISAYLINENRNESVELFFIKKKLDLRRQKDVHHYNVTVYHDFDKNGIKMRGSSFAGIYSGMSDEEVYETIKKAYYAASFVCNPFYELPSGKKEELVNMDSSLSHNTLVETAGKMAEALFSEDIMEDTFLNSAELFTEKTTCHIMNSNGIDVSYEKYSVKGEFVVQCITPQDVETYQNFSYDELDTEALKEKVKQTLEMTKARAQAKSAPAAGEYTVLLSGRYVKDIFDYYIDRSSASMIYPKYSNYQVGSQVQGEDLSGELLTITLKAKDPYSSEGIPMINRPLLKDGILQTIHGNSRFSYYLGTKPTGIYHNFSVPSGTKSFSEMKTGKYLHVVNFSDFQMDTFSGHFAGEIRLAFLSDGGSVTPVTGGSINGSLLEAQKNLVFSKEKQIENGYEGPYAVKFEKVNVAGA
ncbi:hypothetical protein Ana3638_00155 [Anaerocolumna sedimenticola]|uniref:Metalloprotease TldD/E C-terminal domain-containing protein n=1 Tax=Anaerocolumna sedimenticola TaxID=2696063 RepID=A0A6P1TE24_9FIRM|nr:metallopeptidase TldD-related protein [Anaerocolumna sedimenticola]QHQ59404.1 hypothetical protein Ana3638_00155 [Anaerocolumna sedimenticola]